MTYVVVALWWLGGWASWAAFDPEVESPWYEVLLIFAVWPIAVAVLIAAAMVVNLWRALALKRHSRNI